MRSKLLGAWQRAILLIIFLMMFILPVTGNAQAEVKWWNEDCIIAKGYAANAADKVNAASQKDLRKRAIEMARKKLIEKIIGIRVTAKDTMNEAMASAVAERATVIKEKADAKGNIEITLGIPLYGEDSLAEIAFKSTLQEPAQSDTAEARDVQGDYTALVIDCTEWEDKNQVILNPVLIPEIKDDNGMVIYGGQYNDHDVDMKTGYVLYMAEANLSVVGNKPLIVKVVDIADELGTPVVSVRDAQTIISENSIFHFLEKGAVIVLSNCVDIDIRDERGTKTWGTRDSAGYRYGPPPAPHAHPARPSSGKKIYGARM